MFVYILLAVVVVLLSVVTFLLFNLKNQQAQLDYKREKDITDQKEVLSKLLETTLPLNQQSEGINKSLNNYAVSLGKLMTLQDSVKDIEKRVAGHLKNQKEELTPLESKLEHLLGYFGGLKASAGKTGEVALEFLLEEFPSHKVKWHQTVEGGKSVECLIQVAGEWVAVDAKLTKNGLSYIKKQIPSVAKLYLNKKVATGKGTSGEAENITTASYGLLFIPNDEHFHEAISNQEIRNLMVQNQIWPISPESFFWQLYLLEKLSHDMKKMETLRDDLSKVNISIAHIHRALKNQTTALKQMENAKGNLEGAQDEMEKAVGVLNFKAENPELTNNVQTLNQ